MRQAQWQWRSTREGWARKGHLQAVEPRRQKRYAAARGDPDVSPTPEKLELIQPHMAQKPVLRGEVGCACVAREVSVERGGMGEKGPRPAHQHLRRGFKNLHNSTTTFSFTRKVRHHHRRRRRELCARRGTRHLQAAEAKNACCCAATRTRARPRTRSKPSTLTHACRHQSWSAPNSPHSHAPQKFLHQQFPHRCALFSNCPTLQGAEKKTGMLRRAATRT